MAVEIGALRALLSLDSAAFESGAKRAQASMSGLQRSLHKTSENMRKIGRNMTTRVTAPIAAATVLMARSAVNNAVEIERLSQVANAGTTEFQRFAAGARDVGIEQEKLGDILKDVNDRVGDFVTTGGGPMADFFENIAPKVGITAEAFKGLSGPEALQLYVSSLEKAGASQQEMTFYMEAMASDATLLLPLLRDNGKEMGRLADMAAKAGMVMDEKTIKALGRTDDALRAAGDAARGLFTEIMMSLAPVMDQIAEKVGKAALWFSSLSPEMKKLIGVSAGVAAAIGPLALALGFMAAGMAALVSPIGAVVLALGAVAGAAAYVALNWDDLTERFPTLTDAASRAADAFNASWSVALDKLKGIADVASGLVETVTGIFTGDLKRALDGLKQSWSGLEEIGRASMEALLGIMEAIVPGFQQATTDIIAAVEALPGKLYDYGADAIQRFVDGIKQKWTELKESVMSIFRMEDAGAAATQAGMDLSRDHANGFYVGMENEKTRLGEKAREIQQYLEDVARDESETQSPSKVWMRLGRDMMDGLGIGIADKAQAAAESAAQAAQRVSDAASVASPALGNMPSQIRDAASETSTLNNRLAGMFSGALRGAKSFSGFLSDIASQLGDMLINSAFQSIFSGGGSGGGGIFGGLFAGLFDSGGSIPRGQFGIAGERGPEIVTGPARVTSRAQTARMMQGGSVSSAQKVEIVLHAPEGFTAEQMSQVQGVAVRVTSQGISAYDRTTLPGSVKRINSDPRRRG